MAGANVLYLIICILISPWKFVFKLESININTKIIKIREHL